MAKVLASAEHREAREAMDEKFLAECLKAFDPTVGRINLTEVAHAMGYGNSKSAGNRWSALKKTHNIKVPTFYGPLKSESETKEADTPESPNMSPVKAPAKPRGKAPARSPNKPPKAKATQKKLAAKTGTKRAAPETSEDELEDISENSDYGKPKKDIAAEDDDEGEEV